jgi:methylated-DNA-[protein]-cysteine S-methyltransferase
VSVVPPPDGARVIVPSPVGPLAIEAQAGAITRIVFHAPGPYSERVPEGLVAEAVRQLDEYFEGRRRQFTIPLAPRGTPFQRMVWEALTAIGYGETVSYGHLARRIDRPLAVRAVGAANGQNPIPIVIPCHRVVGSTGRLVGFGGGLEVKKYLLGLEQGSLF